MAGEKKRDHQLKAVWFAAGTASFMACIERAIVVSLFAHWRVWVFLVLNLLLLAILFTSKTQAPYPNHVDREDHGIAKSKLNRKKRRQQCQQPMVSTNGDEEYAKLAKNGDNMKDKTKSTEEDGIQESQYQLTKEELNQRVEAFITMFRQQLVSDAKEKRCGLHYPSKHVSVTFGRVNSTQRVSFSHSNEYIST